MSGFVITGTDTEIGKTHVAAMLMAALDFQYWKPVQSGLEEESDTECVKRLSQKPDSDFFPEAYRLKLPRSPHFSAEVEGIEIDLGEVRTIPNHQKPLLIEGAGGLQVPLTREILFSDIFTVWQWPVILCCRTALGTINHSLLSIEALRARQIPIHGLIFIGEENFDNMRTIADFGQEKILGHLPWLKNVNTKTLRESFHENFKAEDFISNQAETSDLASFYSTRHSA